MNEQPRKPLSRRLIRTAWTCAALFAIGYFPTYLLKDYRASILLAAMLAIPFGSKARTVTSGAIRGGLMGLLAGLAMASAVTQIHSRPLHPMLMANYVASISALWAAPSAGADLVTATAMQNVLTAPYAMPPLQHVLTLCIVSSTIACAAAAALFAFLAAKRREKAEQQWQG